MKIGHITTNYKPILGGEQVYIDNLISILNEHGHSQRVYQRDQGVNSPELRLIPKLPLKILQSRGIEVWFFNVLMLGQFLNLRKEDILIAHFPLNYLSCFWHKRQVVISHGVEWTEPSTVTVITKRKKTTQRIRKQVAEYAYQHAWRFVANDTDFFRKMGVAISPKEKMFEEVERGRYFIPNCVDVTKFKRTNGIPELKQLNPILVPRNINEQRGIHLAIQAFAIFVEKYPETRLVIAGNFQEEAYKMYLFRLINDLDLIGKVLFLGSVNWSKMVDVYSSSIMTLIPSTFSEGTSLSALESMACGTPTISTNIGGLRDLPTIQTEPEANDIANAMIDTMKKKEMVAVEQYKSVKSVYNLGNWKNAWLKVIED